MNAKTTLIRAILEFLLLSVLTLLSPVILYLDVQVFQGGKGVSESSITEWSQESLILLSAVLFGIATLRRPQSRGFSVLVCGFFACMFIRELDSVFDQIRHGFWKVPAILTTVIAIGLAILWRGTMLEPMAAFSQTRAWLFISLGLMIVILFSRVMGSGNVFWMTLMGNDYKASYKNVLQEGLELFGYIYIAYGSILYLGSRHRQPIA